MYIALVDNTDYWLYTMVKPVSVFTQKWGQNHWGKIRARGKGSHPVDLDISSCPNVCTLIFYYEKSN